MPGQRILLPFPLVSDEGMPLLPLLLSAREKHTESMIFHIFLDIGTIFILLPV